ncbi:hypothetical protein P775_19325 [Puniceibacterium antarcticum]|uniref:Uncharacterized protein n=1 Tax=Puniceibacterium antarcticum TaxID=1206336 RepID=A0A2G8RAY1_9RHOB|nr:hypothetical protein [Puniceibacterium antarcticum]PIL18725.1 hypothetical protein P775_19325 [Puniceibacterium antarcticum]
MKRFHLPAFWTALTAALFTMAMHPAHAQGMPDASTGPVDVGVTTAEIQTVPYIFTPPGRAVAFQDANIHPTDLRTVERIDYDLDAQVATGDLTFTLQSERYAAATSAEAEKKGAEDALSWAQQKVDRYRNLVGSGVTQADLDAAEAYLL